MTTAAPWPRRLAAAGAYLLAVVLPSSWVALHTFRESDNRAFYFATQLAAQGHNPYDVAAAQALAGPVAVTPYLYPPPSLLGVAWMAPLSLEAAFVGTLALSHLCLLGVLWMLHRAGRRWWTMAALIAVWTPLLSTLEKGQVNAIVLACVVAGVVLRSPLGIALGGMWKLTPWGLGLWLLRLRGGLPAAAAVIGWSALGALLALGWVPASAYPDFALRVLPALAAGDLAALGGPDPGAVTLNHAIDPLVADLGGGDSGRWIALAAKVGLLAVWLRQPMRDPLAGGAALVVLLTVLPGVVWEHHFTLLLLPAWVAVESWPRLGRRWRLVAAAAVLGCAVRSTWLAPAVWLFPELQLAWLSHKTLAALGLFAVCLHLSSRTPCDLT